MITRPYRRRRKVRWYTARRYHDEQVTRHCLDELAVIADYRCSEESVLVEDTDFRFRRPIDEEAIVP